MSILGILLGIVTLAIVLLTVKVLMWGMDDD